MTRRASFSIASAFSWAATPRVCGNRSLFFRSSPVSSSPGFILSGQDACGARLPPYSSSLVNLASIFARPSSSYEDSPCSFPLLTADSSVWTTVSAMDFFTRCAACFLALSACLRGRPRLRGAGCVGSGLTSTATASGLPARPEKARRARGLRCGVMCEQPRNCCRHRVAARFCIHVYQRSLPPEGSHRHRLARRSRQNCLQHRLLDDLDVRSVLCMLVLS